jgi:tetratricopeptide (TPR) repeat protein
MEFLEYDAQVKQAAALYQAGKFFEASSIFERLAEDESLTDMDRAFMYYNAGVTREQYGSPEEVERLYDAGTTFERKWFRSHAREAKARWLEKLGRGGEAIDIYNELLSEGWLTSGERRRFEEAIFRNRP